VAEPAGFRGLSVLPRARSTVDLAAEAVRAQIMAGAFRPGAALPETTLAQSLGVSRNTVREALRRLAADRLVSVEPHRGASVRTLTREDVADIYRARRHLELTAIDALAARAARTLNAPAPTEGAASGSDGQPPDAAEANRLFHTALVAVHGSRRVDEFFAGLMTEMRLGFLSLPDPAGFHAAYRPRNRAIARQLEAGDHAAARAALATYLADAEAQVTDAVHHGGGHG
jgi:DNA-binding GntR family transcriptional regulator